MTTYRFLGIDPGTATTGWTVLETKNNICSPVAYGAIITDKKLSDEERLFEIYTDLEKIIKKYKPGEAAVENIFFFKNQKTIITVAQARGAILLTLRKNRVKIFSYTPLQVKQALTSYGRAEKRQVQLMAKEILCLKSLPRPDDTADAMAVCICHINSRKLLNLIK
jgi:crossover junction endodeoxyribonuclease RuvC